MAQLVESRHGKPVVHGSNPDRGFTSFSRLLYPGARPELITLRAHLGEALSTMSVSACVIYSTYSSQTVGKVCCKGAGMYQVASVAHLLEGRHGKSEVSDSNPGWSCTLFPRLVQC